MRTLRNLLHGLKGVVAASVALTLATAAFALTIPPNYAPRQFQTQQKHYIRFLANFNSCVLASGACSLKIGALPVNSFVTDIWVDVTTAFNSGTSDKGSIGIAAATAAIFAGGSNGLQSTGTLHYCGTSCGSGTFAGIGLATTNATSTGADGGFDLYWYYQQAGTAPTAGAAVYVVEYIAPNDGACTMLPIGATSPAVC